MTYGGTPPAITPAYTGFVNGDTAGSLSTAPSCSTTATSASPAGSYPSSCTGAADPDYTISYVSGLVTVGQAATDLTYTGPQSISCRCRPHAGRDPVELGQRLPGQPAGELHHVREPGDRGRRDLPAGVGDH